MERACALIDSPPRVIQGITLKFPAKLWRIINKCISGALSWNSGGTAVVVRRELFEDEFLSANGHFKTTNFTSFVRQLNIYGFRKLVTRARWYERDNIFEYYHPCFQRGHPELLPRVVRNPKKDGKHSRQKSPGEPHSELIDVRPLPSRKGNKVIFVNSRARKHHDSLREQQTSYSNSFHPLLSVKNEERQALGAGYGGLQATSDIQRISPTRLHEQVAGVVPRIKDEEIDDSSSDETDDSDDIKPDICMAMKREEESPVPSILPTTVTNMSWRSVMTSPDLTVLSQSSAESGTAKSKSMELMFSSVIPQDEQEEDCLTSILKPESPAIPGPHGDAVQRCPTPACTIPGESDDLGSYPFPMGDTLLEYTDDDVGVFTPAYFNPATGMVTLLLPNAGGDN